MPGRLGGLEPTFFSRFECKYVIDPLLVAEIRAFLRSFTTPDEFARRRADTRYPVCSLYLDSEDLRLYHQTVGGEKNRFKLRIRTYDDDPASPAYCEIKSKTNTIVHKRRAALRRMHVARLVDVGTLGHADRPLHGGALGDLDAFCQHVALVSARPIVRVKYRREAWESQGNEPVRITLDTDLQHAVTLGPEIRHAPGSWMATPVGGVILEIKFTERFPGWVHDLVRMFGLKQQAVPKYILSVERMLMGQRSSALAIGGLTLPPLEP